MPIIKEIPPPCRCPNIPNTKLYGEGTIWECDNPRCKTQWSLKYDGFDGTLYWSRQAIRWMSGLL